MEQASFCANFSYDHRGVMAQASFCAHFSHDHRGVMAQASFCAHFSYDHQGVMAQASFYDRSISRKRSTAQAITIWGPGHIGPYLCRP